VSTYKPFSKVIKDGTQSTWIFKKKDNPNADEPLSFNDIVTIQLKQGLYLITCGYSDCSDQLDTAAAPYGDKPECYWEIVSPDGKIGVIKLTDKIKLLNLWGESWYLNTCGTTSKCAGGGGLSKVTAKKKSRTRLGANTSNWTVIEDISSIITSATKAEADRVAEVARLAEIARLAEVARLAEIARLAAIETARLAAEAARIAAKAAEEKRLDMLTWIKDGQTVFLSRYSRPYPWNMYWPKTMYFCSNSKEGGNISWGKTSYSYEDRETIIANKTRENFCGWKMYFPDRTSGEDIISGSRVHLYGINSGSYFHSNHPDGTMSWGGKNISVGWTIHFDGKLRSDTAIHLKSITNGKYFATSNNGQPWHDMAHYGTLLFWGRWDANKTHHNVFKIIF